MHSSLLTQFNRSNQVEMKRVQCLSHRVSAVQVRREGILTFTFNVESAIAAAWSNVADDDFIGFLNSSLEIQGFACAVHG